MMIVKRELLYADKAAMVIRRDEMDSISGCSHMFNNIANAFAFILNCENNRRGVDKKSRFFFSTECYLILCTEKYIKNTESWEDRKKALFHQMRKEMTNAELTTFNNFRLLESFGEFYEEIDKKSAIISTYETRNVEMRWKSNRNKHDCGVFLLKHMETYEGQCQKQWNSELEKDNFEQMKRLRVEYRGKIITSEVNEERKRVLKMARKWSKINKF